MGSNGYSSCMRKHIPELGNDSRGEKEVTDLRDTMKERRVYSVYLNLERKPKL